MLLFAAMKGGTLRDLLLFPAATLLLGTAANLIPGRHLPFWGQGQTPPAEGTDFSWLDVASAETMVTALPNVVILDSRGLDAFAQSHIAHARPLPLPELDRLLTPELETTLRQADAVILYGDADEADVEQLLAQALRLRGLAPPYILVGGYPAWEGAGLPVETGEP